MADLGDDIIDVDIDAPDVVDSPQREASREAASAADAPIPLSPFAKLSIGMQGYLLKKCRHRGDQKPWKKRYFVLRGSSLIYYPTRDAASQLRPKLFAQLTPQTTVAADMSSSEASEAVQIVLGMETVYVAAASRSDRDAWIKALLGARGGSAIDMSSLSGPAVAEPGLATRMRMTMASAVATSSLGQAMMKNYLDPSARTLLRELVLVAAMYADERTAANLKRSLLDVCARLVVAVSEGRMPADANLDALYEDMLSFTQDFLMYSRDQRLKAERGPEAEMAPLDIPGLITPFSRVAAVWRLILAGSCRAPVLARFDEVFAFYVRADLIVTLLTDVKYRTRLTEIDRALRRLLEVF